MAFFDETVTIQKATTDFESLFNDHGWATTGKYRVFAPIGTESYRKTFAEVNLFQSKGSDNQVRNFGMIRSYGNPSVPATRMGDEPIISQHTDLGLLGKGDGVKTVFSFPVYPVAPGSEAMYVDSSPHTDYTIDSEKGTVTFTTPPGLNKEVRSTYAISDNAPSPVKRLWFFTFEDVRNERIIRLDDNSPEGYLGLGDDTKMTFPISLSAGSVMKAGTGRVYVDGVIDDNAVFDYGAGTVTLSYPPVALAEVRAEFIMTVVKDAAGQYNDVPVKAFDATNPTQVADVALSGLNFIFPSIPTAVSFIPTQEYGNAWTRDSQLYYWGNITKDRIVMFFRPDSSPDATQTYFAPLYIGKLSTIGHSPKKNNVIIGGSRVEDEVVYTQGMVLGGRSVDYGQHTSNGNSTVLLQQSYGGSFYQKHYLAFITHDSEIDSSAEAQLNPSVYSGKYHISPMYIVHPSDGYVGRLDEVYAVHPQNISQLDELEVIEVAKDELVGKGDGVNKTFPLFHTPFRDTLQILVDCTLISATEYTIDREHKTITFNTLVPADGVEILANYEYKQVYRYSLADTPITPYRLANSSPFAPIGLGMLKENLA